MNDDYKQKYEELMQRCEEFNVWFEEHKKKMGIRIIPIQPLGPAKTMDIMWPDRIPTTTPWPPIGFQYTYNNVCTLCRIDLNKATHYVCNHPTCPSQIKVTC